MICVIVNTKTIYGAVFVELSAAPNLVISNVIWQTDGSGFYEHDSKNQIIRDNFIGHCTGPGINLFGKVTDRPKQGVGHHEVHGNIIYATAEPIKARAPDNVIEANVTNVESASFDPRDGSVTWKASDGRTAFFKGESE